MAAYEVEEASRTLLTCYLELVCNKQNNENDFLTKNEDSSLRDEFVISHNLGSYLTSVF